MHLESFISLKEETIVSDMTLNQGFGKLEAALSYAFKCNSRYTLFTADQKKPPFENITTET